MAAPPLRGHPLILPDPAPVAIVLPPREGFSADAVGAVGLLVRRLARPDELVIGRRIAEAPFDDQRYLPVPPGGWRPGRAASRYAAGVAALLRRQPVRLIEVHNRPDVAAALARRFPHTPMLLVLHNDPRTMRLARTPRSREALARAMGIATVSADLRERYLAGTAGLDVAVLPNCLDLAALPPACPAAEREPTILFAGRLVADKGADSFVAACALALPALSGWRALMIGADRFRPGIDETPFLAALRPTAARAGVELAGYRPHAAVLAAMARAAIVVVPSRWPEPFGLTALEAMASGAALVCSGRGGLGALVREAAAIVDPDRPAEIAATLRRLAADPLERTRLSAAGRMRAATYDLPAARARLDALRDRLIRQTAVSPRSRG